MSIWSSIGKVVGGVGGFIAGGPAGAVAGYKGAEALFDSPRSVPAPVVPGPGLLPSTMRVPTPATDYAPGMAYASGSGGGFIPEVAGTVVGGIISHYLPGGGGSSGGSGCGCAGSDRDPCTHKKLTHAKAPEATFFGGCCPPGRVLRKRPWARDICAKRAKMNPFNPRALARADRRVTTFARRAAPILHDLGYHVAPSRHVKGIRGGGKRKHARR